MLMKLSERIENDFGSAEVCTLVRSIEVIYSFTKRRPGRCNLNFMSNLMVMREHEDAEVPRRQWLEL
jgi:hypothetical protein